MLYGERVTLRPFRADDLPAMRSWFRDRAVTRNWANHPVISDTLFEADLTGRFASFDRDGHFAVDNEFGELIGRVDFDELDPIDRTCELSIMLGAEAGRGKGYGADACHTLLEHLFSDRQIERVWLSVIDWNAPAIRLYEKLGFVHEGRLERTIWLEGGWHDLLLMGMMKTEYRRRSESGQVAAKVDR
ncbi:MAG: GNAT family N-acetyltransferase [Thermomicrobiales bacterium]|nr:GNAT family N-acetyltransferase [Thermomicrobiales bacterium]